MRRGPSARTESGRRRDAERRKTMLLRVALPAANRAGRERGITTLKRWNEPRAQPEVHGRAVLRSVDQGWPRSAKKWEFHSSAGTVRGSGRRHRRQTRHQDGAAGGHPGQKPRPSLRPPSPCQRPEDDHRSGRCHTRKTGGLFNDPNVDGKERQLAQGSRNDLITGWHRPQEAQQERRSMNAVQSQ